MKKYTVKVFSEVILVGLKKDLEDSDIAYQERVISDSSFLSLNNLSGIGELVIKVKDDVELMTVLQKKEFEGGIEIKVSEIKLPEKMDKVKIGLIIYTVLITGFFFRYWYLDYVNSSDKVFEYKWNTSVTRQDAINKETGELEASFFDENYDFNYELEYSYFKGQGPVMVRRDRNENGYAETVEYYNLKGDLYAYYQDTNNDTWFDHSCFILENGDTLMLTDSDMNGFYEIKKR